ncbi:SsrA-binding protein SmpB [Conexibacter stalactiti]|uniref:SsrA-binding protein n=1 Tax=Conexibacter stalactiti TaxID=1940611 RepID=A0ABU4HPJ5_9ACTN|nr:SsrA-binding protein SmpB [Conexibacter stalactiti]MDW5595236.1 SsrA-binding protein SmpB [Conexibacter stalactiti]MEC5035878.1 SsrA-binding protein SmpB [Conexibacter stalactiti]
MAKGNAKKKFAPGDVASNRQARFRFNLLDTFEAGMVLTGTEVKSLREGGAQMKDSYALVRGGEVWLLNMHIPPYASAYRDNHLPERDRKLLLHRREIERLVGSVRERGLTLVPTRVYFRGPRAKVELALARGKDQFDKRESLKERDVKREMLRAKRDYER